LIIVNKVFYWVWWRLAYPNFRR